MSQPVFEVIAKNPEIEHIPGKVGNASMHEHGTDDGKINRNGRGLQPGNLECSAGCHIADQLRIGNEIAIAHDFSGYGGERIGKCEVGAESLVENKNKYVKENQSPGDKRGYMPVAVIVANRKQHENVLRVKQNNRWIGQRLRTFIEIHAIPVQICTSNLMLLYRAKKSDLSLKDQGEDDLPALNPVDYTGVFQTRVSRMYVTDTVGNFYFRREDEHLVVEIETDSRFDTHVCLLEFHKILGIATGCFGSKIRFEFNAPHHVYPKIPDAVRFQLQLNRHPQQNRFHLLVHAFGFIVSGFGIFDMIVDGFIYKKQLGEYDPRFKPVADPEGMHPADSKAKAVLGIADQHAVVLQKFGMLIDLETVAGAHDYNADMVPFIVIIGHVDGIAQLSLRGVGSTNG